MILKICEREDMGSKGFSPEFMKTLELYQWPGNVRELKNALDWAISKAQNEPMLFPKHLPDQIRISVARSSMTESIEKEKTSVSRKGHLSREAFPSMKAFRDSIIAENEKNYLTELLEFTSGNIKKACSVSGLGRARLYGLMKSYNISRLSGS
jgi:two-component system, NtrC family, response regulator